MRRLIVTVSLLCFVNIANAQSANNIYPVIPADTLLRPFDIIEQLTPMAKATHRPHRHTYSLDLLQAKVTYPAMISARPIWINKGKSDITAINRETADYSQLVPVMVAALQQQQKELKQLTEEVKKLRQLQQAK